MSTATQMWREETGVLEMFLAYYSQFEENVTEKKAYRDFLFDIICAHERSLKPYEPRAEVTPLPAAAAATFSAVHVGASGCRNATVGGGASGQETSGNLQLPERLALSSAVPKVTIKREKIEEEEESFQMGNNADLFGRSEFSLKDGLQEESATSYTQPRLPVIPTVPKREACEMDVKIVDARLLPEETESRPLMNDIRTSRTLSMHERTGMRRFVCHVCNKGFFDRSSLRSHERIHTGERPFVCSYCGKAFNQRSSLRYHERTHAGVRPYVCKLCNKTYTKSTHLQTHQRTHSGERPYVCSHCNKGFKQVSALNAHERTHSGERPFMCKVCKKTFGQVSTCRVHERLHTGEKPFICKVCKKAFNTKWHLQRHENVHVEVTMIHIKPSQLSNPEGEETWRSVN